MPVASTPTITLAELRDRLHATPSLSSANRSEMTSAIKRFCDICDRTPGEVLADPAVIRTLAAKASWQLAGLSSKGWANLKSRLTAALKAGGIPVHRRSRRNFILSDSWKAELDGLKKRDRDELLRFAGWCSSRQISPEAVDQTTFEKFLGFFREEVILTNPKERWHVHRRAWNRTFAKRPGYPFIPDTEPPLWRGLRWSDFSDTLVKEVEDYTYAVTKGRKKKLGEKPLKKITVDGYVTTLRTHLTRLVDDGVPIGQFQTLADCIDPELAERGLMIINGPDEDGIREAARPRMSRLCVALINVARYCQAPDHQLAELKTLFKSVVRRSSGMTEKNRNRLAQFRKPGALERFMDLPVDVAARITANGKVTHKTALVMQNAALLALLQALPLRIKNAAKLNLGTHIKRPTAGKPGPWLIHIPRGEVKNDLPIEAELSAESVAVIERYLAVFRPILAKNGGGALFPGNNDGHKAPGVLSKQLARFIKRELGLEFHAHLIRHWAAFAYLEENPGDYETVRQVLGHKSINVTLAHYASASTKASFKQYDAMLAGLRKGAKGKAKP